MVILKWFENDFQKQDCFKINLRQIFRQIRKSFQTNYKKTLGIGG